MNIQQAAVASGLTPDTIRFYERSGVLPRPPRRANGYRDYTTGHVHILRLARGLKHLGVPLKEAGRILAVAHDGTCGEVRHDMIEALDHALARIEARLRDLAAVREQIEAILDGLRRMQPADESVPGMAPCDCVDIVSTLA
ncbi:MAG TPA: MerR family transcriptional regulator [Dehalococcoidia bacterium]|nr:MerR family transcriptional regulator [Dehalococcoidia bacterium]